jgi:hypothetical protein
MIEHFVTVSGSRAADFEKVFGTATVRVTSWLPRKGWVAEHEEAEDVFELDLDWVRANGFRDALVKHLAERFEQPADFVGRELDRIGVPILAKNCTITTSGREFL